MTQKRLGSLYELFIAALISVGLPIIGLIYFDWRAAAATFVVVNIVLGVFIIRSNA